MSDAQSDIADILGKLESGPRLGNHQRRLEAIMRHFHAAGLSLAIAGDKRHLDRAQTTMRKYCNDYSLAFSDWIPLKMRPPKPKKAKVGK